MLHLKPSQEIIFVHPLLLVHYYDQIIFLIKSASCLYEVNTASCSKVTVHFIKAELH